MRITGRADGPAGVSWSGSGAARRELLARPAGERLAWLHSRAQVSWPRPWPHTATGKDAPGAAAGLEAGLRLARAGNWHEAAAKLNTAMRLVPPGEVESEGRILAARSAVCLGLGRPDLCWQDCQAALASLPTTATVQRVKLWERSAACRPETAGEAHEAAAREVAQSGLEPGLQDRLLAGLHGLVSNGPDHTPTQAERPAPSKSTPFVRHCSLKKAQMEYKLFPNMKQFYFVMMS